MRDKISQRQPIQYRVLPSFFAVFFILALVAHTIPFAAAQIPESSSREPVSFDEATGKTSAQPESPSLILVPNGMAAVSSTGADGATLRVLDISQFGAIWGPPGNRAPNYINNNVQMPTMLSWDTTAFPAPGGIQAVHGLAVKGDGTRIYVGASGLAGANRTPNVFMIGPSSNVPSIIATLPLNSGTTTKTGISSLDLDETHNQLFVVNYADGKIYRLHADTGATLSSFDPLLAFTPSASALPPYGERVNTVAYNKVENRLYYGIWGYNGSTGSNTIRSVGLDGAGEFNLVTDRLEITLGSTTAPPGDIEFSTLGSKMLIAEQPLSLTADNLFLNAHNGRALEYMGGTAAWTLDTTNYAASRKYSTGAYGSQTNCRGGVAWAYSSITGGGVISGNETFIMLTGDALRLDSVAVYGLQFTPSSGGGAGGGSVGSNSLIADLDYDVTSSNDKTIYGDVDIRRSLSTTSALVSLSGQVLNSSGTGLAGATVTLANSDGVVRSTITSPFGYYVFDQVSTNETYIITASAKRNRFTPQVIFLQGEINDVNFTPNQQ